MNKSNLSLDVAALLAQGQAGRAISLARHHAGIGDTEALYCLGTWHMIGAIVPRNLAAARHFLDQAASGGHIDAARMLICLLANGSGAPPDWAGALARLRGLARIDQQAREQLELIDHMQIGAGGMPVHPVPGAALDGSAIVRHFPNLLTSSECDHVIVATSAYMKPALVLDPATGRQIRNPVRTADAMVVSPSSEDLVLRAISLRLAAVSRTHAGQGEAVSVMRYRQGQEFKLHYDTLGQTANQRVKTMLVYLNDGFAGGETVFPHLGLTVRPRKGDAILFDNMRNGVHVGEAQHAGLAVQHGEKWLLSRWIRQRSFNLWEGPERA